MTVSRPKRRGTYAPLAARYYEDEKIMNVGRDAELLYVRSLAFCASSMSDGYMSEPQARSIAGRLRSFCRSSAELLQSGLWRRASDGRGYVVSAWLKWNPSADDIRAGLEQDAARKRRNPRVKIPAGKPANSRRNPAGFLPTDTDTDTEFSDRTPSGSVRSETRDGRSRAPQAAPRPSQRLAVVNGSSKPPDLTAVREQLRSASEKLHSRTGARPDALGELRRLADRASQIESKGLQ